VALFNVLRRKQGKYFEIRHERFLSNPYYTTQEYIISAVKNPVIPTRIFSVLFKATFQT